MSFQFPDTKKYQDWNDELRRIKRDFTLPTKERIIMDRARQLGIEKELKLVLECVEKFIRTLLAPTTK